MRHHYEPQRAKTSLSLGQSGPSPTRFEDADPTYEPPRILGFSVTDINLDQFRRVAAAASMSVDDLRPPPLLWQDEGDQG